MAKDSDYKFSLQFEVSGSGISHLLWWMRHGAWPVGTGALSLLTGQDLRYVHNGQHGNCAGRVSSADESEGILCRSGLGTPVEKREQTW